MRGVFKTRAGLVGSLLLATIVVSIFAVSTFGRSGNEYLVARIAPCTLIEGSDVDPCAVRDSVPIAQSIGSSESPGGLPPGFKEMISSEGFPATAVHVVVRGTIVPRTTRCASYRVIHHPYIEGVDEAGYLEDLRWLECFADVRMNDYIVGTGLPVLTTVFWGHAIEHSYYAERQQEYEQTLE